MICCVSIVSGFMSAPVISQIAFHVKQKSRTSSRLNAEPRPEQHRLRVSILFSMYNLQKVCKHFIRTTDLHRVEQMFRSMCCVNSPLLDSTSPSLAPDAHPLLSTSMIAVCASDLQKPVVQAQMTGRIDIAKKRYLCISLHLLTLGTFTHTVLDFNLSCFSLFFLCVLSGFNLI